MLPGIVQETAAITVISDDDARIAHIIPLFLQKFVSSLGRLLFPEDSLVFQQWLGEQQRIISENPHTLSVHRPLSMNGPGNTEQLYICFSSRPITRACEAKRKEDTRLASSLYLRVIADRQFKSENKRTFCS